MLLSPVLTESSFVRLLWLESSFVKILLNGFVTSFPLLTELTFIIGEQTLSCPINWSNLPQLSAGLFSSWEAFVSSSNSSRRIVSSVEDESIEISFPPAKRFLLGGRTRLFSDNS